MKSPYIRTGSAFAVTVGIGYAACSALFALWPDAAASFMNSLFHGLDFRKLQGEASLFTFNGFLYAELVLMAWAFAMGVLFTWLMACVSEEHPEFLAWRR
jgi:hypothetical protein